MKYLRVLDICELKLKLLVIRIGWEKCLLFIMFFNSFFKCEIEVFGGIYKNFIDN